MPHPTEFRYTYQTLAKLSGMALNSIHQHVTRGNLDPADLESVLYWLARHGRQKLRQRLVAYAMAVFVLPEAPGKRKRARRARPTGK